MINDLTLQEIESTIQNAPQQRYTHTQPTLGQEEIQNNLNNHVYNETINDEEYDNELFNQIVGEIMNHDETILDDFNVIENNNNNYNNNNENLTQHNFYENSNTFVENNHQGDILCEKEKDHLRIFFQNVNGLHAPKIDKWIATINKMLELGLDIIAMCETCVNWYKKRLKNKYQACLHNKSSFGKLMNPHLVTSPIDIPYEEDRVPGGTAMVTAGKWTSRIETTIKDLFNMGRWSGNTYRLSGNRRLHVITAYRPCATRIGPSTSMSTAHQHTVKIHQRGLTNTTPRKQFIIDFINQFSTICNDSNEFVIVSLDANANLIEDTNGLQLMTQECNLIDLFSAIHPDINEFPTQARGSKRIDYMLGTRNVIQFISKIGYLAFNDGFDSDHRAIYADISPKILDYESPITEPKIRLVGSNSTNVESER
jgi:hypothetical protein